MEFYGMITGLILIETILLLVLFFRRKKESVYKKIFQKQNDPWSMRVVKIVQLETAKKVKRKYPRKRYY